MKLNATNWIGYQRSYAHHFWDTAEKSAQIKPSSTPVKLIESSSNTTWHLFSSIATLISTTQSKTLITTVSKTTTISRRLISLHLMKFHSPRRTCLRPRREIRSAIGSLRSTWTVMSVRLCPHALARTATMKVCMKLRLAVLNASAVGSLASSLDTRWLRAKALSASSAIWALSATTGTTTFR